MEVWVGVVLQRVKRLLFGLGVGSWINRSSSFDECSGNGWAREGLGLIGYFWEKGLPHAGPLPKRQLPKRGNLFSPTIGASSLPLVL
jgi:hypothetical protein